MVIRELLPIFAGGILEIIRRKCLLLGRRVNTIWRSQSGAQASRVASGVLLDVEEPCAGGKNCVRCVDTAAPDIFPGIECVLFILLIPSRVPVDILGPV